MSVEKIGGVVTKHTFNLHIRDVALSRRTISPDDEYRMDE